MIHCRETPASPLHPWIYQTERRPPCVEAWLCVYSPLLIITAVFLMMDSLHCTKLFVLSRYAQLFCHRPVHCALILPTMRHFLLLISFTDTPPGDRYCRSVSVHGLYISFLANFFTFHLHKVSNQDLFIDIYHNHNWNYYDTIKTIYMLNIIGLRFKGRTNAIK